MENQVFERQIFKVGDRVFDAAFGWGEVFRYDTHSSFQFGVNFDSGDRKPYTWDGRLNRDRKSHPIFQCIHLGRI
jgi:hypothetical protein